ncbi:hypothetical protein LCGC14_0415950 [marine sediment metagenome]|uniref:PD-(D/E)XK endonuclease-like domain-containing protein n=1 Tax=marine sediment metagenome TaxID=412755 RepID=A0A0F9SYG1_9ZZZZ
MTQNKRDHWKLSASWLKALKSCPMRCYYSYIKGIRPIEETEALRMGTNWHELLEVYSLNNDLDEAVDALNVAYENKPMSKTLEEWAAERAKLAYSLSGYIWNYSDVDMEVVAREIPFSLKIINPDTGATLPNVEIVGKIDKIVKVDGKFMICEHKSTSKDVSDSSQMWAHLRLDTQTTLYQYAAMQLKMSGELEQFGIGKDAELSGGLYDVWRKPTISPKMLTQGDSKKFLEDGMYMGQEFFSVRIKDEISVDSTLVEYKPGAKEGTFAIRETAEMYGARLLHDITERPEHYFARKPLNRSVADMKRLERELYSIYQNARTMNKNDSWYTCEDQCEATFHCSYIPICYNNVNVDEYLPEGFKNIKEEKKDAESKA